MLNVEAFNTSIDDELGKIALAIATVNGISQHKQVENLLAEYNRVLKTQVKEHTQELLLVIEQLQTTQQEIIQSQKIAAQRQQVAEQASQAKSEFLDTGAGISPQEIDLLFEAFGQTETGRKSQHGTGLGLAISRKYVQLMGGDISVSSILGKGSKFTFDIQIGLAKAREIQTQQTQRQIIGLAPEQQEYRILVVDDVADSRLALVKLLTLIGFVVREAVNGEEAIAQWLEWQPSLIFMDMRMPVMDGYQATKMIKDMNMDYGTWGMVHEKGILSNQVCCCHIRNLKAQLETTCDNSGNQSYILASQSSIPYTQTIIIALTASAFEEERQKILSIGCDDFIHKPFTQELLLGKISQHLGVEYISRPETAQKAAVNQKTQTSPSEADMLERLSQMSPDWLQKVCHAAASCSDDIILDLIQHIPPDKGQIFQFFKYLANNYQLEKIMELTKIDAE